jgi:hypothetical protein
VRKPAAPRFLVVNWDDLTGPQDIISVGGGLERVRLCLRMCLIASPTGLLQRLFSYLLVPAFSDRRGMPIPAGSAVYRLAKMVHKDQLPLIKVGRTQLGTGEPTSISLKEWMTIFEDQCKGADKIFHVLGTLPELPGA